MEPKKREEEEQSIRSKMSEVIGTVKTVKHVRSHTPTPQHMDEMHTMRNWCTLKPTRSTHRNSIYAAVKKSPTHGYEILIPKISAASPDDVWNPFNPKDNKPVDSMSPEGLLIGSKDGGSAYRITGILGSGEYGIVFRANTLDPSTMLSLRKNEDVALKFMLIKSKDLIMRQHQAQPRDIGMDVNKKQQNLLMPGSTHGLFLQYIMQMSYDGCIPDTMPTHNVFFFASPDGMGGSVQWCMVVATELMDGNVKDILSSKRFREMDRRERFGEAIKISYKITRAIHNLETHGIFNDDIKLQNFLSSTDAGSNHTIKVMDFDLGFIAGRMLNVMNDNDRLAMRVVMDYARRTPNGKEDAPWVNDPGTRYITRSTRRSHFQPPEYDIVSTIMKRMRGVEARFATGDEGSNLSPDLAKYNARSNDPNILEFRMKSVYNADWLSRMMAFELTCAMREIFILAGLSPHYRLHTGEYPTDMGKDPKPYARRCACSLVKMMPDGEDNIYPPEPAYKTPKGLIGWKTLRDNTIESEGMDPKCIGMVKELNDTIARIIAPVDAPNPVTHLPMRSVKVGNSEELLCSNTDASNRPTTMELLKFLIKIAKQCNIDIFTEDPPVPMRKSLNADVTAIY
jgi:serine/threonine protein kinase